VLDWSHIGWTRAAQTVREGSIMTARLLPDQWLPRGEEYEAPHHLPVKEGERRVTMTHVAGRASKEIKGITKFLWIYAIANIVLTWWVSIPSEPFFRYPWGLWVIFFVVFGLAMKQELEAYKYVVIPFNNFLAPWATSHAPWKMKKLFLSAISKPVFATNGCIIRSWGKSRIAIIFNCNSLGFSDCVLASVSTSPSSDSNVYIRTISIG